MRSLLALLLAAGVSAQTVAPVTEGIVSRAFGWEARKALVAQDSKKLQDAYKAAGWNDKDLAEVKAILGKVDDLLANIERKARENRDFMTKAIDAKVRSGALESGLGSNLKHQLDIIYCVRMYFLYGNMWPRIVVEGFGKDQPTPESVLGSDLDLQITQDQLDGVTAVFDFSPAQYGLPNPPNP